MDFYRFAEKSAPAYVTKNYDVYYTLLIVTSICMR